MTATIAALQRIAQGREAEIFAWEQGRVLRLFREPRSHDVLDREAAAMRAARTVLSSVPEVFDVVEIEGRPGLVMERVDGPDLISLLSSQPWRLWSAGRTLGRLHAAMHEAVAPGVLVPLKRRLDRVLGMPDVPADAAAFIRDIIASLPDGDRLCHGDFHPGNVLMSGRGPVIIDWPNATAGDPAADFARTDLLLRLGDPPPGTSPLLTRLLLVGRIAFRSVYRRAYLAARPTAPDIAARWQTVRAAERLIAENIEPERERLLAVLRAAGAPL